MKRSIAALILIWVPALFTGCFKQDTSLCLLEDNFVLLFELEATARSAASFTHTISSIDVDLFDERGDFVTHVRVDKDQLEDFQGVRLTVAAGLYYVAAWGNVTGCSELSTANGSAPTSIAESYLTTVSSRTGCDLYYAPGKDPGLRNADGIFAPDYTLYEVKVLPNVVTRKRLDFVRVNRRVNVYLQNFDTAHDVLLAHFPYSYDYFLQAFPARKDFRSPTSQVEYRGLNMDAASFRTPVVPFEDAMTVNVVEGASATTVKTLYLKQWVEDNASAITDPYEIDILFTRNADASVSITVPDWADDTVKPIW